MSYERGLNVRQRSFVTSFAAKQASPNAAFSEAKGAVSMFWTGKMVSCPKEAQAVGAPAVAPLGGAAATLT